MDARNDVLSHGYNTTDDPTDYEARQLDEAEERRLAEFMAQQSRDDLAGLMSTRSGRRYMWRLIDLCGMWRGSFTAKRRTTEYLEGQRSIALMLWGQLQKTCPELLVTMQEENR